MTQTQPHRADQDTSEPLADAPEPADAGSATHPAVNFGGRLNSLSRTLSRRIEAITSAHGLAADHWYALDIIVRHDGVAMNDLARALGVPAPTLTKFVDRLVSHAFVFRLADPGDRRRVLVHASTRGASTHAELTDPIHQAESEVLELFASRDRQALLRMLDKYASQVEKFTAS